MSVSLAGTWSKPATGQVGMLSNLLIHLAVMAVSESHRHRAGNVMYCPSR